MKELIKIAMEKGNLPITSCILFDGCTAKATDLQLYASTAGTWNFQEPRLVEAKLVKAALAINPKKPEWNGSTLNGVELVAAKGMTTADFPTFPVFEGENIEFLRPLGYMLTRIKPAMAVKDIRYYLNGLLFDLEHGVIAATDGHRLHAERDAFTPVEIWDTHSKTDKDGQNMPFVMPQAIIPRELFDLVKPESIAVSAKHAKVNVSGVTIIVKLIDGKFPNYERVIPARNTRPTAIPFNGAQIMAAKQILQFSKANKEKWHSILLSSNACNQIVARSSLDKMVIPFAGGVSEHINFGVNAEYLLEAMQAADHGELMLASNTESLLINHGSFTAVVMPMRV